MGKQKRKKVGRQDKDILSIQSSYVEFLEKTLKSKLESKKYTLRTRQPSTKKNSENGEKKTADKQPTGTTVFLHRCKMCRKAYVKIKGLEKHEKSHEGTELKIPNKVAPETTTKTKDKSKKKKRSQSLTEDVGISNTDSMNEPSPVTNFPDTLALSFDASTIQPSNTSNFHDIRDLISKSPNQQHSSGKYQNVPVKKPAIYFQPEEDEASEPVCTSFISSRSEDVVLTTMSTDEEVHAQGMKILDFLQTEETDGADMNCKDSTMNMVPVTLQPVDDEVDDEYIHLNTAKNSLNIKDLDMKSVPVSSEIEKEDAEIPEGTKLIGDLTESNGVEDDSPYEGDNGEDDDYFSDMDDDDDDDDDSSGIPKENGAEEEHQKKMEDVRDKLTEEKIKIADVSKENEMNSKSEICPKDNRKHDCVEDIHVDDVNNLEDMGDKNVKSTSLFSCSVCLEEFEDDDTLQTHKRKHVTVCLQDKIKSGELPCDVCGKKFKNKIGLGMHKKIHSRTGQVQDNIKKDNVDFFCDKCGGYFKSKKSLGIHQRVHSQILQCKECDQVFERVGHLRQHMISHSKIQHICETCGKTYTTVGHLNKHITSSHNDTTYECKECGKVFKHTINLNKHMKTHFGTKSFVCEVCGNSFLFSSDLRRHTRIHKDMRDYVCKTCGKAFRRSYALKTHMLTHTKEKPYRCIECGVGFNHNVSLRTHKERFH